MFLLIFIYLCIYCIMIMMLEKNIIYLLSAIAIIIVQSHRAAQ